MAVTGERKLEVARRSFEILTEKYGMRAEDLYFDPLVFPCATGDEQYIGSRGRDDRRRARSSSASFPTCKTVLGISNVTFGLPAAGREVLNSVFLYHCTQAGLDMALVNSEKLERYPRSRRRSARSPRTCSCDSATRRPASPVAAFAAHFRGRKPTTARTPRAELPLDERLARYIVEGTQGRAHRRPRRRRCRRWPAPLDIINGPLMKGMDEVGRLFNANELIVAEVLQSAEAMKAAVAYLEPHMEKKRRQRPRQGAARHRQGRRPRHRQEPGRHHPRQQRLPGGEPGHQGAAASSWCRRRASTGPTSSASPACW